MPCKAIPADSNSRQEKADLGRREQLHANEWRGMQKKGFHASFSICDSEHVARKAPRIPAKESSDRTLQGHVGEQGHAVTTHDNHVHKPSPWHSWCGTRCTAAMTESLALLLRCPWEQLQPCTQCRRQPRSLASVGLDRLLRALPPVSSPSCRSLERCLTCTAAARRLVPTNDDRHRD